MDRESNLYSDRIAAPARSRLFVGLLLLAAVIGVGLMVWTVTRWQSGLSAGSAVMGAAGSENMAAPANAGAPGPAAIPAADLPPATPQALDARMIDLEQRLMRVTVSAQAASGYASRAEAIMIAFASRRALDAGAPLGYLEGQLRLLFGEAQPKAVATIINAAGEPVTINKLRAGLEDISLLFDQGAPGASWWTAAMRQLSTLVVIRRAGEPSSEPDQRLARARRAVEAGQIEDAIADVAALPAQPAIAQWLEQARRYNEAHRALDVIEAAAILQPRAAPVIAPVAPAADTPAQR